MAVTSPDPKNSPVSSDSTSLSSSFVSDTLHADSSQSDTDHSAGHLRTLHSLQPHRPSSSSPDAMGQSFSKPSSSSPTSPVQKGISFSAVAGVRLKRAFAGRRKRSEDVSNSTKKLDHRSALSVGADHGVPAERPQRSPKLSLQLATQVLTGGRKSSRTPLSPVPPPLPPKPANMQGAKLLAPLAVPPAPTVDQRSSIIALSPGISSAVNYMRTEELREEQERKNAVIAQKENDADKRKSDSTMSHHTIRPGATGTRTPRPVSMAESLQTICANNRRSLLEDGVPEEDESLQSVKAEVFGEPSAAASRSKNRRSASLSFSPPKQSPPPIVTDFKYPSKSLPEGHPAIPAIISETPTLTRAAASGIISPSSSGAQSTGNNIRGRLAAWTATTNSGLVPVPHKSPPAGLRQTAMSMSTGLAPAAGLAKRAVEKMGRWGGFSSSSSASGYSSSSSSIAPPSSYDHTLARTSSNSSKKRRTPGAPSGAWSINSSVGSASLSDSDAIMPPSGPSIGLMVRAPLVKKSSGPGLVFGRDLRSVTKATGIGVGVSGYIGDVRRHEKKGSLKVDTLQVLEGRLLPALVVRCAQHILIWGVQEEGLFRVSGRPAHTSKLRSEFDSGADFDMRECSPGELDPHAVASVFKAFLRELPEPILTRPLIPHFEEALAKETNSQPHDSSDAAAIKLVGKGPGLPSNPKSGFTALRKPPSLSTLAMPSFQGMPPPSKSLLDALNSLIFQLPPENRDLLRTVTELIKVTASHHKQTKMPLSNLLLVFCPSLNMNPPLLRILCEADGIWETPAVDPLVDPNAVIDIKRDSVVLDIRAPVESRPLDNSSVEAAEEQDPEEQDDNERFSDARDGTDELDEAARGQDVLDYDAVSEKAPIQQDSSPVESPKSDSSHRRIARSRPMGPRRQAVPAAIFQDSDLKLSPGSSIHDTEVASEGSVEGVVSNLDALSSPPLSSSESLRTPSNSSAGQSFEHLHIKNDEDFDNSNAVTGHPFIADSSQISLPATPRKSHISSAIQFPSSGSAPSTPLSPRRSIPLLSLPNLTFNKSDSSPASAPASPRIRLKKPSISLFTKRSVSALGSSSRPVISSPYLFEPTASESSISTPLSAVTAPQSSSYVIDTPVDSSPLRLGLELDIEVAPPSPLPISPLDKDEEAKDEDETVEELAGPSYRLGTTPIADRFRSDSVSSFASSYASSPVRLRTKPARQVSQASFVSIASSSRLDLLSDEPSDEWTKSVLLAAGRDWNEQITT